KVTGTPETGKPTSSTILNASAPSGICWFTVPSFSSPIRGMILAGLPSPIRYIYGTRSETPLPWIVMPPEYSPARGREPESVTTPVPVAPAATVRLFVLSEGAAPVTARTGETARDRPTGCEPLLVIASCFAIGREPEVIAPKERFAGLAVTSVAAAAP